MSKGYALVTGASSGIGLEIARQLAGQGYPLILVARRKERLDALHATLSQLVDVVVLDHDLSAANAAPDLVAKIASRGLQVEVLVNNAGVGMQGRFIDMEPERIEAMCRLNMTSLTQLTQLLAKQMVAAKRGYILQVSSMAAFLPTPQVAAYAATKSYVLAFSEALQFELRGTGVSVTTLYPGITDTEFDTTASAQSPALMKMSVLSAESVARAGLAGMFARRRAVVPGAINKVLAFILGIFHRGTTLFFTGHLMERANRGPSA